ATLMLQFHDPPSATVPPASSVLVAVRLGQVTPRESVASASVGCTLSTAACPVAVAHEVSVVSVVPAVPPAPMVCVVGETVAWVALQLTGRPISSGIWAVVRACPAESCRKLVVSVEEPSPPPRMLVGLAVVLSTTNGVAVKLDPEVVLASVAV